jgi:hypothetical protein
MRDRVRVGIEANRRRPPRLLIRWRLVGAVAAVVLVAVLLRNSNLFSENVNPPYTVNSEIHYYGWNSRTVGNAEGMAVRRCWLCGSTESLLMTSYNQAGSEVILSWSAPGNPLGSAFLKVKLAVSDVEDWFTRRFLLTPVKA